MTDPIQTWHKLLVSRDLTALEALITEFKVMLRPLKAVNLVHQKMGGMLQRRRPS